MPPKPMGGGGGGTAPNAAIGGGGGAMAGIAPASGPVPKSVLGCMRAGLLAASRRSACEPWRSVLESRLKA